MKTSHIILAVAAVLVNLTGIAGAGALPRGRDAEVKRAAEARPTNWPSSGFCGFPGTPCLSGVVVDDADKHAVDAPLEVTATTTKAPFSAEMRPTTMMSSGFCGFPGTPCLGGVAIDQADKRRETPTPFLSRPTNWPSRGFCGQPGTPCLGGVVESAETDKLTETNINLASTTVEASTLYSVERRPTNWPSSGFCGFPGTSCLSGFEDGVEEDELAETTTTSTSTTMAPSSPYSVERRPTNWPSSGFCGFPGTPCLSGFEDGGEQDKRAVDAPLATTATATIEAPFSVERRPTTMMSWGFCGLPGTPCLSGFEDSSDEDELTETITTFNVDRRSTGRPSSDFCGLPGTTCIGGFRVDRADKRAEIPDGQDTSNPSMVKRVVVDNSEHAIAKTATQSSSDTAQATTSSSTGTQLVASFGWKTLVGLLGFGGALLAV